MAARKKFGKKNILVGITGGIGAGKSSLARVFSEAGYPVLSADVIAREVVAPGQPALAEIAKLFGASALTADGHLDRARLRAEISRDPDLRRQLEAITHPRIQELSLRQSQEFFRQGAAIVFYEAPLLFEANSDRAMDAVICVHAPDDLRIERVVRRDHGSREEAARLLASQMPQDEKMRRSDYLVANEDDENALAERAQEILADLKKRLGED